MAASWDTLAREHGPQIAAYNAPPEPEESSEGEEQEYAVRVEFVASTIVTITARSRDAALDAGFMEPLNSDDAAFAWRVIDTEIWDGPNRPA